jgi:oxygen-independent coproporphyrinogen III oxidase
MAGIYIHIPFCAKKCSYCDFHFSTSFESYRHEMVDAICCEIALKKNRLQEPVSTVYFGGGTPSILNQKELNCIIDSVTNTFLLATNVEYTLESNPDDCTIENLNVWKNAGINRLSIGIQSFETSQLSWMNRAHSPKEAIDAIWRVKQFQFEEISLDVMYGLPNQTMDEWKKQLEMIVSFEPDHISAYCLTIESQTPLSKWVKEKRLLIPTQEQQSDQFLFLLSFLKEQGYENYEISNFAKNKAYSKHNTSYWQGKLFLGIGPSAHEFNGTTRSWNVSNNIKYINSIQKKVLPETVEVLSKKDCFNELLMTGLRTKWGVDKRLLFTHLAPSENWFQFIKEFELKGWLIDNENSYILTQEGKLRADLIASELFIVL